MSAAETAPSKRSCRRRWTKPIQATSSHQLFGRKVRTVCSSRPLSSAVPMAAPGAGGPRRTTASVAVRTGTPTRAKAYQRSGTPTAKALRQ